MKSPDGAGACPGSVRTDSEKTVSDPMNSTSLSDRYSQIDMNETGKRLRNRLGGAGIPVAELSRMLGFSSRQAIYRWFRGEALPSVDHLYRIGQILGCRIDDLLVAEGEREETDLLLLAPGSVLIELLT